MIDRKLIAKEILKATPKNHAEHIFNIFQKVNANIEVKYKEFIEILEWLKKEGYIYEPKQNFFRRIWSNNKS